MGNRMSQYGGGGYGHLGRNESGPEQLDYDGDGPEPYDPNMPRLRGGDVSYYSNAHTSRSGRSTTAKQASYGRLSSMPIKEGTENDFYEVPATEFYAAQGSRGGRCQASPVAGRRTRNGGNDFDFNDTQQSNPWQGADSQQRHGPEHDRVLSPELQPGVNIEVTAMYFCYNRH